MFYNIIKVILILVAILIQFIVNHMGPSECSHKYYNYCQDIADLIENGFIYLRQHISEYPPPFILTVF